MLNNNLKNNEAGSLLIAALIITELFLILGLGMIGLVILKQKLYQRKIAYAQALDIAEAGVNYYRWVLYHDHNEYCNNEACQSAPNYGPYGPYEYRDSADASVVGKYELYIIPPALNGSTIVKIKSVGWVENYPNTKRTIEVLCGIPSWSSYSTLADDNMRFGQGTEVWGPIHSNFGIRFDGLAHNLISSALSDYDDPDHSGANEFGVHTHIPPVDPLPDGNDPPENVPSRPDVFMAGRVMSTGNISFNLLNNYAYETYALATSSGIVFDPDNAGSADPDSVPDFWGCGIAGGTCDEGFHISLRTDGFFNIRGVSAVLPNCSGNGSNSISAEEAAAHTYAYPANGIIFIKKRVWVDGQINGHRLNIIAFEDPFVGGTADINIVSDLLYTYYDGTDAIGLIAQRDVSIGQYSADILRVDAALVARDGRIGRNYYGSSCANYIRNTITVYGSLATKKRYGFAYTDGTGYQIRNLIYDNNLTFAPPPHFPTTGEYTFISWDEK